MVFLLFSCFATTNVDFLFAIFHSLDFAVPSKYFCTKYPSNYTFTTFILIKGLPFSTSTTLDPPSHLNLTPTLSFWYPINHFMPRRLIFPLFRGNLFRISLGHFPSSIPSTSPYYPRTLATNTTS